MSDILAISVLANNAQLLGLRDFLDEGTANAVLRLYGTTKPPAGGAAGGSALVTITLAKPSGELVDNELRLTMDDPVGYQVFAPGGTAVWARLVNGDGAWVADGDVSDADGSGAFKLAGTGTVLYPGGYVTLGTTAIA